MKQIALTMLGYSSFSAVLLMGQAAKADLAPAALPSRPLYAEYINPTPLPSTAQSVTERQDCGCQQSLGLDPGSDTVGDLAIDQMGCDCPGCRNIVMQMVQANSQGSP